MSEKRRLRVWRIRLLMFLAVVGPGIITANVDNDAGGIYTYSAAGAQFGYLLLWTMIPMTVALVVVQEMSARMGAITGKGLSDLIREEYGLRITFFMMLGLVITNFGNVVAEFAGVASSLELFHISRYVSVPLAGMAVWLMVVKGTYKSVEKAFLAASFFYFTYIIAGVLAGPALESSFCCHLQTTAGRLLPRFCLRLHGHRSGRNDHCPMDAVLLAIVDCGEGNHPA